MALPLESQNVREASVQVHEAVLLQAGEMKMSKEKPLSLLDKCRILREASVELSYKCASAISGEMDFTEVRHYSGKVRRIQRTIDHSIQKAAKKQRQARAAEAMKGRES